MLKKKLIHVLYNSNYFKSYNFFIFFKQCYILNKIKYNASIKKKIIIVLGGDGEILKSQACIFTSSKNLKKKGLKKLINLLSV